MLDESFLTPEHISLIRATRIFAERELEPLASDEADTDAVAREMVRLLAKEGLLRLVVPETYGGTHPKVEALPLCLVREELARCSGLADSMFAMQGLGSYPITLAGSEAVKRQFLPAVTTGEAIAAFALTEPEAGSDAAAVGTTAELRGDSYYLNGTKRFISNAGIAAVYSVFARTGPDSGRRGISAFVVSADAAGLEIGHRPRLTAPHPIGEVHFRECSVPADQRLGEEGTGYATAMRTLDLFRTTVGAGALGLAQRALEEAVRYAQGRVQFGRPIAQFQSIQFKLAEMATEVDAARLLVRRAAWLWDQGIPNAQQSSMAKLFATEMAQRTVDQAVQIHGGLGLVVGQVVERLYREVRALRIYEGTSEIQHLIIARHLLPRG